MAFDATSTKNSKLQIDIAGTYTDIPGVQNFTPDPGENGTFEAADITSDYDKLKATGVGGGGSVSGSKLLDTLDPVDQYLQARHNAGGGPPASATTDGIEGKAFIGDPTDVGTVWDWEGILTKWAPKAERKNGWMVDFEFKLVDRMAMNIA